MKNDKCQFCGAEIVAQGKGWINYKCGSDWIDQTLSTAEPIQSCHCKLIVSNRELEERHKRLVEAAKEVIDEDEGSTKVWRYIERLRKAAEDDAAK